MKKTYKYFTKEIIKIIEHILFILNNNIIVINYRKVLFFIINKVVNKNFNTKIILQEDKITHSFYGTIIFLILLLFFNNIISLIIIYFIATSKEIYDYFNKNHTCDIYDFLYTIIIPTIIDVIYYIL